MSEIEVQKLVIKEAFAKEKVIPDFGGIGDENTIKLRNYIWKVCGSYLEDENSKKGSKDKEVVASSKKNALVALYRLWSAFTKNIRYLI